MSSAPSTSTAPESHCGCGGLPPTSWERLKPPPDPSLVWHLISPNEEFEKAPSCSYSPHSPNGPSPTAVSTMTSPPLLMAATAFFGVLLITSAICAICIIRKRSTPASRRAKGEAVSTEAILASADHLWSYNSMKSNLPQHHSSMGLPGYGGGGSCNALQTHTAVPTPATIRHLQGMRHSSSAGIRQSTLRIVPGEPTVVTGPSPFHTLGRHYEEIGDYQTAPVIFHGTLGAGVGPGGATARGLPYVVSCSREGIAYTLGPAAGRPPLQPARSGLPEASPSYAQTPPTARGTSRKPPPTCRPPPPPSTSSSSDLSPTGSLSSSIEHELKALQGRERLPNAVEEHSPPEALKGRESGYGTAPSRQWKSPPGSSGKGSDDIPETRAPPLPPSSSAHSNPLSVHTQSMTYV